MANEIYPRSLKRIGHNQSISFGCRNSWTSCNILLAFVLAGKCNKMPKMSKNKPKLSCAANNQLQGLTSTVFLKKAALGTESLCTICLAINYASL